MNEPGDCIDTLKKNKERWAEYEEDQEDAKVYAAGELNTVMADVRGAFSHEVSAS